MWRIRSEAEVKKSLARKRRRRREKGKDGKQQDEEAQNATQRLNGKALHGRNLTVNEARPREDFAGSGSGARNKSFSGGGNRGGRSRRF